MNAYPDQFGTPHQPKGNSTGLTIGIVVGVVLLVTCVCGVGLMAWLLPTLSKARDSARDVVAISNVRQVTIGMTQYAQQYGDRLPPTDQWVQALGPYTGGAAALFVDSPRIDGQGVECLYAPPKFADGSVAGYAAVADPTTWIVVHEDPALLPAETHTVVAGFLDGHVTKVTRAELAQALAKQAAPVGPSAESPN